LQRETINVINKADIRLYCGVGEKMWNYEPVTPRGFACISPVAGRSERTKKKTPVRVPEGTQVIQDSGAFSDNWTSRLDFAGALARQEAHAKQYKYEHMITHRATYDLLIDEVWTEDNREKRRWNEEDAEAAVAETIAAAKWLNEHRNGLNLVISAQGVTARQYLKCVEGVLPYIQDGDYLGLGGWCVIGRFRRQMLPIFRETLLCVIPFIASQSIRKVHIWGVIMPQALGELLWMCDQYGIEVSTDSSGVCTQPIFGQWGYGEWRDNSYTRPDVSIRGKERIRHLDTSIKWLSEFKQSRYFVEPKLTAN
jgi:hypothetical protein